MPEKKSVAPSFISTYATILLKLQGSAIANLPKRAEQYSTSTEKKSPPTLSDAMVSAQQIPEEHSRAEAVISLATAAFATVQMTLNAVKNRSSVLIEQQAILGKELIALSSIEDQTETNPNLNMPNSNGEIQSFLTELKSQKEKLAQIKEQLQQNLHTIDKTVEESGKIWLHHYEEYFDKLATQLKELNIPLTGMEKFELRRCIATAHDIKEKRESLEKLGVKISSKASDFTVAIYDAVTSVLSRSLQKISNDSVNSMVKKLLPLAKEEAATASTIKEQFEKQFREIIKTTTGYKKTAEETIGLSDDQLESTNQATATLSKLLNSPGAIDKTKVESTNS